MTMMPSIFGESLFDNWMDDFPFERGGRNPLYGKREKNLMKTDVKETEKEYELDVDLPGFKKEEVCVKLNDGYLTISAEKSLNKDETRKDGTYLRKERWVGNSSRSFYVGTGVTKEDIKANMHDGILHLTFPKKSAKALPAEHTIMIEG